VIHHNNKERYNYQWLPKLLIDKYRIILPVDSNGVVWVSFWNSQNGKVVVFIIIIIIIIIGVFFIQSQREE
jgi:hypothetical protein